MRRNIGRVPFDAVQLLYQLLFCRFARRDTEQKTDHQADLGTQEPVPLENDDKVPFVRVGIGTVDDAGMVVKIVTAFFKKLEIVGSDETADRIVDRIAVEARDESDEIVLERVAEPLFDDVAVDTPFGAVAGMKIVCYEFDPLYPHGRGELNIEHFLQTVQVGPKIGKIDMDDLVGGVNAAVGPSRGFRGSGDFKPMQYGDEMPHYGVIGIRLLLRAHKRRAVVAQRYFRTAQKRLPTRRL